MILTSKRKRWLDSPPDFYPEIGFERTLGRVILDLIAESGRDITVISQSENVSSMLSQGRRFADMALASGERLFMASFSLGGVTLASFHTTDLREFAKAVELWLLDELALRDMKERLRNFQVSDERSYSSVEFAQVRHVRVSPGIPNFNRCCIRLSSQQ
jgi:hypothetical protein